MASSKDKVKAADPSFPKHEAERAMLRNVGLFKLRPAQLRVQELLGEMHKHSDEEQSDVSDTTMIGAMAKRLTKLEQSMSEQKSQLDLTTERLHEVTVKYDAVRDESKGTAGETILQLKCENENLKKQVHEMERFLNDYGLVWVGYRAPVLPCAPGVGESKAFLAPDKPPQFYHTPTSPLTPLTPRSNACDGENVMWFDMKQLREAVEDVNALADMSIVQTARGASFQPPAHLPLTIYRNGMYFRSGPLRRFDSSAARRFLKDLLDGFFPFELKEEFPDGVYFDLHDRATQMFNESNADATLAGAALPHGQAAKHLPRADPKHMLARLPATTIRQGRVVSIRTDLEQLLSTEDKCDFVLSPQPGRGHVFVVPTPSLQLLQASEGGHTPDDIASVQVKLDDSTPTLLLKMRYSDTVKELYAFVRKYRQSSRCSPHSDFELRSTFPSRVFRDSTQTLLSAGLTPTSTIFARTVSAP